MTATPVVNRSGMIRLARTTWTVPSVDVSRHRSASFAGTADSSASERHLRRLRERFVGAPSPASPQTSGSGIVRLWPTPGLHRFRGPRRRMVVGKIARPVFNKSIGGRRQCRVWLNHDLACLRALFRRAGDHIVVWWRRLDRGAGELECFRSDSHTFVGSCARHGCLPADLHGRFGRR